MASVQAVARTTAKRRSRTRVRPLPLVLTVAAIGGLGYWAWARSHPADDSTAKMLTAPVTRGDLLETVNATGSVTAQTGAEVKIGSQITGVIKRLFADVGTQVKAGQVIAELDLPDIAAQLDLARANFNGAQTKYAQQQTGLPMQIAVDSSAVKQAEAQLRSTEAKLQSAQAAYRLQYVQTPNDIQKAETTLETAKAALATANATYKQTVAGAQLQIGNAQAQVNAAKATASNSSVNLKRQTDLYQQGFVAAGTVDDARAQDAVNQAAVQTAQQNLSLVQQKVDADLETAKDQVTQAKQTVASTQAALTEARAGTYTTAARLADVSDAKAAVNQAAANLRTALANQTQDTLKKQDVMQAQDALNAAAAQVNYNQAEVNKTFIRSPISGTVLQLAAQQGETLAAGLSAPTLIVVADLHRLQVDVFVDETDIGKVRIGQRADVQVDAFPKHTFHGRVQKIASGSTIQQGVVTYDVTISIELNPKFTLKPDMTATATITTGKREGVLLVPSEAVKLGQRGSTVSIVTKEDGKTVTQEKRVKTGGTDGVNTEIREGVNEGDTVVTASLQQGNFRNASPFGPRNNNQSSGGARGGRGGR